MGGEIGLMLGASILSFFEVVDLLLFLIYNLLLTPLHKKKKDKNKYNMAHGGGRMEHGQDEDEGRICSEDDSMYLEVGKIKDSMDSLKPPLVNDSYKSGSDCDSEGDRVTTL